ncbi:hypothetical protein V1511DRAFT_457103 [Dipodascopsis uninucleata]
MKKSVIKRRKRVAPPVTSSGLPRIGYNGEQQDDNSVLQYGDIGQSDESDEEKSAPIRQQHDHQEQGEQQQSTSGGDSLQRESGPTQAQQNWNERDSLSPPAYYNSTQQSSKAQLPSLLSVAGDSLKASGNHLNPIDWRHSSSSPGPPPPPPPIDFTGAFQPGSFSAFGRSLSSMSHQKMSDERNSSSKEIDDSGSSRLPPLKFALSRGSHSPSEPSVMESRKRQASSEYYGDRDKDQESDHEARSNETLRFNTISSILNPSFSSTTPSVSSNSDKSILSLEIPEDVRDNSEKLQEFINTKRRKVAEEIEAHKKALEDSERLLALYDEKLAETKK